jgi:hypothetical protein
LGTRWLVLGALVAVAACGKAGRDESTCRTDEDCDSGERCEASTATSEEAIYGPCPHVSCDLPNTVCPDGTVCRKPYFDVMPGVPCGSLLCLPPCDPSDASTCEPSELCRADGTCSRLQCDEPGGITCPEHWRCEPAAVASEPFERIVGSTVLDPANAAELLSQGCVRKRCSEEDGYVCRPSYACRESESTEASGCVAVPCEETGHCADDARFICEPTNDYPRTAGTDENGCVWRNCTDGLPCTVPESPWVHCDPTSPRASDDGCVIVSCEDGNACILDWVCDPSSPRADAQGCVVPRGDPGTGGSSGTGGGAGMSGSGTAGQGATSAGGTSAEDGQGRCVEQ